MRPIPAAVLTLLLLAAPAGLEGQVVVDPASPGRSVVLLENQRVLMVETSYEPGSESAEHTHASPRTLYVLTAGILELVAADGSVTQLEVRRGQALWRPAETHVVRNVGPTRVSLVETEIKGGENP